MHIISSFILLPMKISARVRIALAIDRQQIFREVRMTHGLFHSDEIVVSIGLILEF